MSLITETQAWLTDAAQWSGTSGIPTRTVEHLVITAGAVAAAAVLALPAGMLIGHTRRGTWLVGAVTGAARAIPTLGLLTMFALSLGIGLEAPFLALVVLAVPSLLAGTYAGIQALDRPTTAAARAIGMSPIQVLTRVEVPLALPLIVGGLRAATLQVVATATLAAYTADYGLGRYLFSGLKSRDYAQMLGGAIVVTALALVLEVLLAGCQRLARTRIADPARGTRSGRSTRSARSTPTPIAPTRA